MNTAIMCDHWSSRKEENCGCLLRKWALLHKMRRKRKELWGCSWLGLLLSIIFWLFWSCVPVCFLCRTGLKMHSCTWRGISKRSLLELTRKPTNKASGKWGADGQQWERKRMDLLLNHKMFFRTAKDIYFHINHLLSSHWIKTTGWRLPESGEVY